MPDKKPTIEEALKKMSGMDIRNLILQAQDHLDRTTYGAIIAILKAAIGFGCKVNVAQKAHDTPLEIHAISEKGVWKSIGKLVSAAGSALTSAGILMDMEVLTSPTESMASLTMSLRISHPAFSVLRDLDEPHIDGAELLTLLEGPPATEE